MSKEITDYSASVRQKLLNLSRTKDPEFLEYLADFGMERFLYRMGISKYKDHFVLKGALMLKVWDIKKRRRTLDIDLLSYLKNDPELITKAIREICDIQNKEDGIGFDSNSVKFEHIQKGQDYVGLRIKLIGKLENAKIPIQIDFGFGDKVFPTPKKYKYPTILDLPSPEIKGYPIESLISEKFHAMISHGALNSRMKDFYDIWILRDHIIDAKTLGESIIRTFEKRGTSIPGEKKILPEIAFDSNSEMQKKWEFFIKKRKLHNVPEQLQEVATEIESFFKAPLREIETDNELEKDIGMEM